MRSLMIYRIVWSLLISTLFLNIQACTAIGYGIGNAIDSASPDTLIVSPKTIHLEKPGTSLYVILDTGDTLTGEYETMRQMPVETYTQMYHTAIESWNGNHSLPVIGDSIQVVYHQSRATRDGTFIGFDPGKLWMQIGTAVYPVNLDFIDTVSVNRVKTSASNLDLLLDAGEIPLMSSIRIHSKSDTHEVRLDRIQKIKKPVDKYGARVGILLGLSTDVIVFLGIQQGWISIFSFGWGGDYK